MNRRRPGAAEGGYEEDARANLQFDAPAVTIGKRTVEDLPNGHSNQENGQGQLNRADVDAEAPGDLGERG